MISNEDGGIDKGPQTLPGSDVGDSKTDNFSEHESINFDIKPSRFNKNETRSRRSKLKEISSVIALDDAEISSLASAGMMMPDPYCLLLEPNPFHRLLTTENIARNRVQLTNLMVPPVNVDELLEDDPKPVRIGSKEYMRGEKSMSELMIAVRSSSKVLSAFRVAYSEQYALHEELLRLVQERQVISKMRRSLAPGYLIDFARMLESLGCKRNHLRLVNSRIVILIRDALKLNSEESYEGFQNEAGRLQRWLDEDEALSFDDNIELDDSEDVDEFDRLSRIAAKALMDGDLTRAKSAFSDLEAYDELIEEGFGAESIDDGDTALDEALVLDNDASSVNEPSITEIEKTAEIPPVVSLPPEGSDIILGKSGNNDSKSALPELPVGFSNLPEGASYSLSADPELPSVSSTFSVSGSQKTATVITESKRNEQAEVLVTEPVMLTNWGERADPNVNYYRGDGYGRVAGSDGFGGIVSMASGVSDVIPMWLRENRPSSMSGVLGLNDWYKIEVPAGNYALVHMPRRLPEFLPVSDKMFPPYRDIERYGEEAGFSVYDMRGLNLADSGRGGIDEAIRALRAGVVMRYGKDDEDLVRFWAFLVLGRNFMEKIDVLFPDGYFHGVIAPDAGAEQSGVGYLSIVRVLNDRKLSNKIRTSRFPPFDSLELVSSLDGLKL